MKRMNLASRLLAMTAGAVILLAACSSPAITGIKVHLQNQEYDEAVHLADSVIAAGDSLNAELWLWRGRAQANVNDWEGSSESFIKVHQLDPTIDLSEYWYSIYNAAASRMNDEDLEGATELLVAGTAVAPTIPNYDLLLGDIHLNMNGDLDAALEHFLTASEKGLQYLEVLNGQIENEEDPYILDYYYQVRGETEIITIQGFYNAGSVLSMKAQTADTEEVTELMLAARQAYESALAIDPTNIDVLEAIAEGEMLQGNYQAALDIYDEAFVQIDLGLSEGWLDPDEASMLKANMMVSKGFALIEMENYTDAITELNTARGLIGDDFLVLATLAHAQFMMEEYHTSLEALDTALLVEGLSPQDYSSAYHMQFACYSRLEMDEEAAVALENALDFDPDNCRYWELLASTYSRLGRRNDAIDAMQRAEELGID